MKSVYIIHETKETKIYGEVVYYLNKR